MSESVSFFRAWRFDRSRGAIDGLHPLDPDQLPFEHCRLVYDEAGRLARIEEHGRDLPLPSVKVLGYASPDSFRIVEALDYNPDGGLRLIHRYLYDPQGRVCDRIELDGNAAPRGHVASTWDEHGQETEERVFSAGNELTWVHEYDYDPQGRVIRERVLAGGTTLDGSREMDYDEHGNVVEKRWFNSEGVLQSRFVHIYDDRGLILTSTLLGGGGELRGKSTFEYDEAGNLISET